eukprot:TRINITY_DN2737_c1_g1_i1.p1 TRINITY_DN2737_c1_g1~~TRINITY_DN2737_c1_g1_i1.p1  ORF type:complete len:702 (-),score=99.08 TRINITY_DN2737_c1_g1_i1:144-2249(-)
MKPLRHAEDFKGAFSSKKSSKGDPELPPTYPLHEPKYIPIPEKFAEREEQPLHSRKPSSMYTLPLLPALDGQCDFGKIPNPLHAVAKERIFGGNFAVPQGMSERDRRLMLREMERKKRSSGAGPIEAGSYGQLSAAGANIAFQHESEIESKSYKGSVVQLGEKCVVAPNAYHPNDFSRPGVMESEGDEYLKFLPKQPHEQERKKPLKEVSSTTTTLPTVPAEGTAVEPKKASSGNIESFIRYKKKEIDPELLEKREKQRVLMQNELNRQIEEKQKRKLLEKQREKEEAEREEQRIRREQAELAAKYKGEGDKIKPRVPPKQNLFTPSLETNTFTHVVQGFNPNSSRAKHPKNPEPDPEPLPRPIEATPLPAIPLKVIEDYQKQIESLKKERQLAKEEALAYKEQLLKERELQLQSMMAKVQPLVNIQPIKPLPPIVESSVPIKPKAIPPVRPETKETCEESLESSTRRVPTRSSNHTGLDSMGEVDLLEQSLVSNTKLVAVTGENDLYKTWKPFEIQQHLVAKAQALKEANSKRVSEVAIQTLEAEQAQQPFASKNASKPYTQRELVKKSTKATDNIEESIRILNYEKLVEEDYSQASFESDESEKKNDETEGMVLFESRKSGEKVQEESPALAKSKPKTINIFKKLDESREKAKKLQKDLPAVVAQSKELEKVSKELMAKSDKQRPFTVSKKQRYSNPDV